MARVRGSRPFSAAELIATVRQAKHLKSQVHSRETARLVMANPLSGIGGDGQSVEQRRQPGGDALRTARKRLDIAAMLYRREWYCRHGPCFRYLASDASPQMGQSVEIFVTVERILRRAAVQGRTPATLPSEALDSRILPMVTLGAGRASLLDKVASHLHQTHCDYGPSVSHVAASCCDVRQVMSDMGTEFGICNFGNAIGQVLGERWEWTDSSPPWTVPEAQARDRLKFLYPFALQTPGLLHIVDWVIRSTVEVLPWWAVWQLECKRLLQFCHGVAHRDRLRVILKELGPPEAAAASLEVGTGRFAEWRWKTLARAVKDLARIEEAMRFLARSIDFTSRLASRDAKGMGQLQATCGSPLFWDRGRTISALVEPLMQFMGRLQGCECHEQQVLSGQALSCPFKGCRARKLSWRLQVLRGQLSALRDSLRPNSFGCVEIEPVSFAVSHCLATVALKFMWVDELPYLVWQVAGQTSGRVSERLSE